MKTFVFAFALAVLLTHAGVGAQNRAVTGTDDASVRAWLTERIANRPGVGIVVGIYESGRTRVIAAGGGGPNVAPLGGGTLFEIGSATKLLTAAALADMAARGELNLEDSVQKFLPADVHMPTRSGAEIRLVDLATHSSGLPRMPTNFSPADGDNPYPDYTAPLMYQFLSSYQLIRDIGERYEYSNLGFGLLGHVLAVKNGTPYYTMVANRILRPLQMKETVIDVTPALHARAAVGHTTQGNPTPNWTFDALAGAGALRSTADDMLKFVAVNLEPMPVPDTRRRTPHDARLRATLQSMHEPRHALTTRDGDIGLGWHIRRAYGDQFVWHNGGTYGFHSFVGLNHRTGVGVVVLHNSGDSIDDIGFHMLDERFPLAAASTAKRHVVIDVPAAVLDSYVGTYGLAPDMSIAVARDGDTLVIKPTGQPKTRIYPESPDQFFVGVVDAQISFVKDAAGKVAGMTLHQGGRDMPGRRVK